MALEKRRRAEVEKEKRTLEEQMKIYEEEARIAQKVIFKFCMESGNLNFIFTLLSLYG